MTIEQKLKGKNRLTVALGALCLIVGIVLGSTSTDIAYEDGFRAGQQAAWGQQGGVK